ncbi:MAG TPA: hypothetical protein PKD86_10315, partial [Gemmatales bacterium]|nr:hypothetical protein [Gemmatales bacterium]
MQPNKDDELLRRAQQRQQIEEQRLRLLVEETIRQARKDLSTNPSESVTRLKLLADEVRGDPNISDELRARLGTQIENDLRTAQTRSERFAI